MARTLGYIVLGALRKVVWSFAATSSQNRASLRVRVLVLMLAFSGCAPLVGAQSFSSGITGKKKVTLHRKLPAAIKLAGTSTFSVAADARAKDQADVAQSLADILTTELQKNDKRLQQSKDSPELTVACTITHYEIPPPQVSTRSETILQKGHAVQIPKQYYRITGELEVAYQAKDAKTGKVLDAQNLSSKYNRQFESGTNEATDKSLGSRITDPFKRLAGKKVEDEGKPPTALELRLKLVHDVVSQVAARLVSTDEAVEVQLARGKQLDSADKLAEGGLWSRYLETLETMTPFPDPHDDAYRLYDIGVANEALAYQSEDLKAAKKFLEEAAIHYGKAIDARPDEKSFVEPQTRIETAVTYYRKLDEPLSISSEHGSAPETSASVQAVKPTEASAKGPLAKSAVAHAPARDGSSSSASAQSTRGVSGSSPSAGNLKSPAAAALTNQKVIDMLKGGVDEDSIIATIHDAPAVQFDLSPDGQIQLAQNGVKAKLLAAMRERARRAIRAKSTTQ